MAQNKCLHNRLGYAAGCETTMTNPRPCDPVAYHAQPSSAQPFSLSMEPTHLEVVSLDYHHQVGQAVGDDAVDDQRTNTRVCVQAAIRGEQSRIVIPEVRPREAYQHTSVALQRDITVGRIWDRMLCETEQQEELRGRWKWLQHQGPVAHSLTHSPNHPLTCCS